MFSSNVERRDEGSIRGLILTSLIVFFSLSVQAEHSIVEDSGFENSNSSVEVSTIVVRRKTISPSVLYCVFSPSECLNYACPGQMATIGNEKLCEYEFGLNHVACLCSPKPEK